MPRGGVVVTRGSHKPQSWVQFPAPLYGNVAQWLEQWHHKPEVAGSNPAVATSVKNLKL